MMKRLMMTVLLAATGVQAGELKLELQGKSLAGNQIHIAVYSASQSGQFPAADKFYRGVVSEATGEKLTVSVPDLPPGKYAVAVYVDSNKNGRHDKNILGVPKEDYGFSNDARGRFGPPDFADAAFDIGDDTVSRSIHIH